MTEREISGIVNGMEASIRGYTFTMEEAREISRRFLQIMVDSIAPSRSAEAPTLVEFTPEPRRLPKLYDTERRKP